MTFTFDAGEFIYMDFPTWEDAEAYAKDHMIELLGEHVETHEGPLWLTEGETLQ